MRPRPAHALAHLHPRRRLDESLASNQASVAAAKGYNPHAWDYMVNASLQTADDAEADKVGTNVRTIRALDDSTHFEVFGVTAIAARLALERGRWAEAATLELHPAVSEAGWKRFPQSESVNAFARALGAARSGDAAGARREIERPNHLRTVLSERKLAYWAEQTEIQAQVATAWALYAEGKNDEALAEAHNNLAFSLRMQGTHNSERALTHYQRAIELKPDLARAYLYRGALFTQIGDFDRARAAHAKLLQLDQELAAKLERIIAWVSAPDDDSLAATYN